MGVQGMLTVAARLCVKLKFVLGQIQVPVLAVRRNRSFVQPAIRKKRQWWKLQKELVHRMSMKWHSSHMKAFKEPSAQKIAMRVMMRAQTLARTSRVGDPSKVHRFVRRDHSLHP